jgi:hypothetical protein
MGPKKKDDARQLEPGMPEAAPNQGKGHFIEPFMIRQFFARNGVTELVGLSQAPGVENALASANLPAEIQIVRGPKIYQGKRHEQRDAQGVRQWNAAHAASIAAHFQ